MNLLLLRVFSLFFIVSAIGCSSASSEDQVEQRLWHRIADADSINQNLYGNWEMEGYGRLVAILPDSVTVYHRTSDFCVADSGLVPRFSLYSLSQSGTQLSLLYQDYGPNSEALQTRIDLRRLPSLPHSCTAPSPYDSASPVQVFDLLWTVFRDHYAFFKQRGVDWDSLGQQYRPRADALSNLDDLFPLLSEMLAHLNDGHINLYHSDKSFNAGRPKLRARLGQLWKREGGVGSEGAFVSSWHRQVQESVYGVLDAGNRQQSAAGALEWGTIRDSIAYMRINRFRQFAGGSTARPAQLDTLRLALQQMMDDIEDTKAAIVDVSLNGGGMDAATLVIAGCFTDSPQAALTMTVRGGRSQDTVLQPQCDRPFTKPVVLITSEVTASAAEGFTLLMRALPNVTHVGGSTRGILSGLLPVQLPQDFVVTLSNQEVRDVDGRLFEDSGIAPHREIQLFPDDNVYGGLATTLRIVADSLQAL